MKTGDKESTESTYRYVADDGSSALVTFKNDQEGNTITIKSNNATLYAKQEKSDGKTTIYKNQNVEIKSEGDHVTITQENNVIELKKARGQWYLDESERVDKWICCAVNFFQSEFAAQYISASEIAARWNRRFEEVNGEF